MAAILADPVARERNARSLFGVGRLGEVSCDRPLVLVEEGADLDQVEQSIYQRVEELAQDHLMYCSITGQVFADHGSYAGGVFASQSLTTETPRSEKQLYALIDNYLPGEPVVIFEDFGDSALIFDVFFWCHAGSERELRAVRSDVRFRVTGLFEEHGIVIAFPQRDVHLYDHTARSDDAAAS